MPELPEVQTTVNGLQKHTVGLRIKNVWSNYNSLYFKGSETIKDPAYFKKFKKLVTGGYANHIKRRAKNILIELDNGHTILIHMKMTGHLLYGTYRFNAKNKKDPWEPIEPENLKDPYNRHIRFVLSFTNGKELALSDVRRFAKVTLINSERLLESNHIKNIGPEPLEKSFTLNKFSERINLKPKSKIKQVLTDQSILAGIGNIYADESLWRAGIHPLEQVKNISPLKYRELFNAIKKTLTRGIDFGGDSTSDYRNIHGEKGKVHESHHAYQQTGKKCGRKGCGGTITRIMLGARSTHFCSEHQKYFYTRSPKK